MNEPPRYDFRPTASWETLCQRAELLQRLRAFFTSSGFVEVETPILSSDTVVDRHLDPFSVEVPCGSHRKQMWLQTSPEFAMKRLLTSGAKAIFQVAHVFRLDEQGPLHNPEFTLVEWYRTDDSYHQGMHLLSDLSQTLLHRGPATIISYREAFLQHVGVDPLESTPNDLREIAQKHQLSFPESLGDQLDPWLDFLLSELVQPQLGTTQPAILCDYPASQAALSGLSPDDPRVAQRFELYVNGIELANGYHELLDPAELRRRNHQTNLLRLSDQKKALPEESRLLEAMEHGLPACVGCALGFDRLAMIALGQTSIDQVIPFPFDRA